MNRTGFKSRVLAAGMALGLVGAPTTAAAGSTKADMPRSPAGYLMRKEAEERKRRRDALRRPGEKILEGKVWPWLHKLGHIVSMGTRPHCRTHLKRFKYLRVHETFWKVDGVAPPRKLRIKVKRFGCPTCLRRVHV